MKRPLPTPPSPAPFNPAQKPPVETPGGAVRRGGYAKQPKGM